MYLLKLSENWIFLICTTTTTDVHLYKSDEP
ncbi:UNVERIFIED_ORG: hypothetical protein ABIC97_003026 [Peribacillus simplex]